MISDLPVILLVLTELLVASVIAVRMQAQRKVSWGTLLLLCLLIGSTVGASLKYDGDMGGILIVSGVTAGVVFIGLAQMALGVRHYFLARDLREHATEHSVPGWVLDATVVLGVAFATALWPFLPRSMILVRSLSAAAFIVFWAYVALRAAQHIHGRRTSGVD